MSIELLCIISIFHASTNALFCLFVVFWIDLLDELDVLDELLVNFLAGLNGEVGDVGFDRLHVGLNEAVDLDELEESAHRDAAHIHQQYWTFLLNAYHLVKQATLEEAMI